MILIPNKYFIPNKYAKYSLFSILRSIYYTPMQHVSLFNSTRILIQHIPIHRSSFMSRYLGDCS